MDSSHKNTVVDFHPTARSRLTVTILSSLFSSSRNKFKRDVIDLWSVLTKPINCVGFTYRGERHSVPNSNVRWPMYVSLPSIHWEQMDMMNAEKATYDDTIDYMKHYLRMVMITSRTIGDVKLILHPKLYDYIKKEFEGYGYDMSPSLLEHQVTLFRLRYNDAEQKVTKILLKELLLKSY